MFSKHIFILLLLFTIVFVLSELWNLIDKYTSDFDVKLLSIKDLQVILKYRGINYKGLLEKKELINLIQETGQTSQFEWTSAKSYVENENKCNQSSISVIPNEDLFNELVEDSKDSAWILMTIFPKSWQSTTDEYKKRLNEIWCHIQSTYAKYGVNMAILDCSHLYNLCWNRGFHRSPFILVLPRGRIKIKDTVDFFIFPYSTDLAKQSVDSMKKSVINWLRMKLAYRVNQEHTIENTQDSKLISNNVLAYFISIYTNISGMSDMPPTSISAHSVKFTGRIHFWSGTLSSIPSVFKEKISQKFAHWKPPGHFFISSNDLIYQYGLKAGQIINFDSLQLFFRDLCPNSNDIFIWNLLVINILISFQVSMQPGSLVSKFGYFLWYFLIFNIFYCLVFISLLSSLSVTQNFNRFIQFFSFLWQNIVTCSIFERLRYLQLAGKLNFLLVSAVWLVINAVLSMRRSANQPGDSDTPDSTPITDNQSNSNQHFEPWDPEAGHQIALLTSLGNFNLTLENRSPQFLSRLFLWSYEGPPKFACKPTSLCDLTKSYSSLDESELGSTNLVDSNRSDESKSESKWPHGYIFSEECCICLERFRKHETICGLPCSHVFHHHCIKVWLDHRSKDHCPVCRWPVYKEKP